MNEPYLETYQMDESIRAKHYFIDYHSSGDYFFPIQPHWHPYIEILYFIDGSAKCYLDGHFYHLKAGDMVFINHGDIHAIFNESHQMLDYYVIKFNHNALFNTMGSVMDTRDILLYNQHKSAFQRIFTRDEIGDGDIPDLIKETFEENKHMQYGFESAIKINISKLFLWHLRHFHVTCKPTYTLSEKELSFLKVINDLLTHHYHEEISTQWMAKQCNMSYSYFSRYFKKLVGKTFIRYMNDFRISEAEKLLLTENLNITEIAFRTGFATTSYFIKQFKRVKNTTPHQYRNHVFETFLGAKNSHRST
ncbi:AraC family transcriptional regulator [Vallitalea pronyensis]|uniref:AraC family transcriptional regulator n=1 Tax=Vallitalea pronyensis TaxID=1348613 RepID=A0A8J8MMF9_9FIRM|nr:AraC family transcriptional regulator [Vallitalea pronyensis]QUI24169.1 AraC family transcriptional regulator [Vallitalea pronyensis]